MKFLLATFSAMLLMQAANAQGIAAGVRSGIGGNFNASSIKQEVVEHNYWQKQLFGRYETKKKLAFEVTAGQYNYSFSSTPGKFEYFAPPAYEPIKVDVRNNVFELGASAQYDLSCGYLKDHCPVFKNFRSYLGVNMNVLHTKSAQTYTNKSTSDGTIFKSEQVSPAWTDLYVGLSHTTTYSFKHIFLTSSASLMASPFSGNGNLFPRATGSPNTTISLMAGVGYKF